MILLLVMEDGNNLQFGIGDTVQAVIRAIRTNEVETIVVGSVEGRKVTWEKQFAATTVMSAEFGNGQQSAR